MGDLLGTCVVGRKDGFSDRLAVGETVRANEGKVVVFSEGIGVTESCVGFAVFKLPSGTALGFRVG